MPLILGCDGEVWKALDECPTHFAGGAKPYFFRGKKDNMAVRIAFFEDEARTQVTAVGLPLQTAKDLIEALQVAVDKYSEYATEGKDFQER